MDSLTGPLLLALRIGSALALYTFLGWVLLLLWRDLKGQAQLFTPQIPTALTLKPISKGIDSLPITFRTPQIQIGRDPSNQFIIDDETVSAKHARLVFRQKQWWVEDLHSQNGTHLNEFELTTPTVITHGDQLRFGKIQIEIGIEKKSSQQN